MSAKFTFYQEVRVVGSVVPAEYRGSIGVVMGITDEEHEIGGYGYSVHFPDKDEGIELDEIDLEATGNFFKHEDFYDGSRARVSADGELLEVSIVDDPNSPPR